MNYLLVKPDLNGWFLQKAKINYFKVEGLNPVRFGVREFDTVLIDKRVFGLNQPFRPPKGTVVYFDQCLGGPNSGQNMLFQQFM